MSFASLQSRWSGYVAAVVGIIVVTFALKLPGESINSTTVALAMLLVVLFTAARWGARPAIVASLFGVLCFNYFFLPPVGKFTIYAPDNWIALFAFLITAITAGQLSARVKRRAEEAEAGRREIERLYDELRSAFERASHAEALRQSEKLKSALLDAVTHDLRTPLTSIKASVTTLLDETTGGLHLGDEERREMLEVINEECDRLNRFIEGLVELARIEAGELRLGRRWGTIEEMTETALARARKITEGRKINVGIENELPVVLVDPRAVSEVIYTLVENAVKYSDADTSMQIAASRATGEMIKVSVEDNGRGIPVEFRDRVFDKFFRATRDQSSGTGMGLAIAKGIVEAHGGRIWIESGTQGRGTRVIFTVPIGDEEESGEPQIEEAALAHRVEVSKTSPR
ncbi:MAG TPA: ATP-binding protein [Blastocatellia bacterium]|nr:ATP-binding protein [Blastocatellia bacterium]